MIVCPLVLSVIAATAGLTTAAWNVIQILHRRAEMLKKSKVAESSAAATVIQRAYRRHRIRSIKNGPREFTLEDEYLY
jgi:hypothetical protein